MTAVVAPAADRPPTVGRLLEINTPYGRPVSWAEVAMVTDIGDSHELNDDRCLVVACKDLGEHTSGPLRDFILCVLADGATGSTFGPAADVIQGDAGGKAGWRASQIAQAVFVERFLSSPEVDILDRLKDGLRAADRALVDSGEGSLSTTLTALFLAADGTAYAASIGDSVLLVLPPSRKTPADRRLKKLGYEDTTAVGSGDTTLSFVDETELIEQWWPNKEGGRTTTHVEPGTYLVLASDGLSDTLPADFIDTLLRRHRLDQATVALPVHTRERRSETQKLGGGSTNQLGLDNMSAIVIRFDGARRMARPAAVSRIDDTSLVCALGTHGGPSATAGGQFGVVCLAGQDQGATAAPGFLRAVIEAERERNLAERLSTAFLKAMPRGDQARFGALVLDEFGATHTFSNGGANFDAFPTRISERVVAPARETLLERFLYTPRLWASSLAALALFLLVSTAFATGTVRPAPPPAPTPAPGEPTPTPDTRPALSFGGFQLVAPVSPATPTPVVVAVNLNAQPLEAEDHPDVEPAATAPPCGNLLGIGCAAPPAPAPAPPIRVPAPPPSRNAPAPQPQPQPPACTNFLGIGCPSAPAAPQEEPVLPAPSPVPGALQRVAPPAGSQMDDALQAASVVDRNVHRGLSTRLDQAGPPP